MKKEYMKPEAIIVDIELYNSVLETPGEIPASEPADANEGIWEDKYDKLPTSKSVWDDGTAQDGTAQAEGPQF